MHTRCSGTVVECGSRTAYSVPTLISAFIMAATGATTQSRSRLARRNPLLAADPCERWLVRYRLGYLKGCHWASTGATWLSSAADRQEVIARCWPGRKGEKQGQHSRPSRVHVLDRLVPHQVTTASLGVQCLAVRTSNQSQYNSRRISASPRGTRNCSRGAGIGKYSPP